MKINTKIRYQLPSTIPYFLNWKEKKIRAEIFNIDIVSIE
jgi:hypothetical protein